MSHGAFIYTIHVHAEYQILVSLSNTQRLSYKQYNVRTKQWSFIEILVLHFSVIFVADYGPLFSKCTADHILCFN